MGERLKRAAPAVAVAAVMAVLVVTDWVPAVRGPAPYPPEWQWLRREGPTSGNLVPALLAAAALVGLAAYTGSRHAAAKPVRAARLTLFGVIGAGLAFSLGLLALEPAGAFETVLARVVYRTATSYYTVAVSPEGEDPLLFLRQHDQLLPYFRKAAKHAATHPPGPVLYYRAWLAFFEANSEAGRLMLRAAGIREENPAQRLPQHSLEPRAAALAGGLGILLTCALTAWPVAWLARALGAGELAAARLGVLWAALPGPALMAPMLDQAIALPMALAAAALAAAVHASGARSLAWAAAAGTAGGVAIFLTYGAPALLVAVSLGAAAVAVSRGVKLPDVARPLAVAAAVTVALFAAPALVGHKPIASALAALAIHRDVYTKPRNYALWLVFDLVDLAVFLGAPLAAAFVARLVRRRPYALGTGLGLLLLLVSGTTRGEVGRLWIPLMPAFLVAAAGEEDASQVALLTALCAALAILLRVFWALP